MTETLSNDSEQALLDGAVVIALGSNLPGAYESSRDLLDAALKTLDQRGLTVIRASAWWRSKAWPTGSGPDFLNGVALVETERSPSEVLEILQSIESRFGRHRSEVNGPRTLDLDLVAHGRVVMNESCLELPHPRASERHFVMGPLAAISPDWVHPVAGKTASSLDQHAAVGRDAHVLPV